MHINKLKQLATLCTAFMAITVQVALDAWLLVLYRRHGESAQDGGGCNVRSMLTYAALVAATHLAGQALALATNACSLVQDRISGARNAEHVAAMTMWNSVAARDGHSSDGTEGRPQRPRRDESFDLESLDADASEASNAGFEVVSEPSMSVDAQLHMARLQGQHQQRRARRPFGAWTDSCGSKALVAVNGLVYLLNFLLAACFVALIAWVFKSRESCSAQPQPQQDAWRGLYVYSCAALALVGTVVAIAVLCISLSCCIAWFAMCIARRRGPSIPSGPYA